MPSVRRRAPVDDPYSETEEDAIDVDGIDQAQLDASTEEVVRFLKKHVTSSAEVGGSVHLALYQTRNGGERRVKPWTYTFTDVEIQAREIVDAAEEDCTSHKLKGKIKYKIVATVGAKMPFAVFHLFVASGLDAVDDAFDNVDNIDPSAVGREAMNQRHTEAFARIIASQARSGEKLVYNLYMKAEETIARKDAEIQRLNEQLVGLQSQEFARKLVLEDRQIEREKREKLEKIAVAVGIPLASRLLNAPPEAIVGLLSSGSQPPAQASQGAPVLTAPDVTAGPGAPTLEELQAVFAHATVFIGSIVARGQDALFGLAAHLAEDEQQELLRIYAIVDKVGRRRGAEPPGPGPTNGTTRPAGNGVRFGPYDPSAHGPAGR